jgi:hypothetical protein
MIAAMRTSNLKCQCYKAIFVLELEEIATAICVTVSDDTDDGVGEYDETLH